MKTFFKVFYLLLVSQIALAIGGHDGSGGGGVIQNGQYLTFGSAGFYINPGRLSKVDLPETVLTAQYFAKDTHMSPIVTAKYRNSILPSDSRVYYRVDEGDMNKDLIKRLIEEYQRVVKVPPASKLTIFAITDTNKKTTYLLPNFFKLSSIGKQAILFHESQWIVRPKSTYEEVINAEIKFQHYIENLNNFERYLDFVNSLGNPLAKYSVILPMDLASGAIKDLLLNTAAPAISLKSLFGNSFGQCQGDETCAEVLMANLLDIVDKHPNSYFLSALADDLLSRRIILAVNGEYSDIIFNKSDCYHTKLADSIVYLNPTVSSGISQGVAFSTNIQNEDRKFYSSACRSLDNYFLQTSPFH